MTQNRPIVLIDDNPDEIRTFRMALDVLNVNAPLHLFGAPQDALAFLQATDTPPGLILCDFRLSAISGIDLRRIVSGDPRQNIRTIPFILLSSAISDAGIIEAFELPVQGLFIREPSFGKYLDQLDRILKYWSCSVTPDSPRPPQGWK